MPVRSNIALICGGITPPVLERSRPRVGQTTVPRAASAAATSGGVSKPFPVMHEQCSMPSTPAVIDWRTAGTPCACAVTGRPSRCASSTTTRSSVWVNWHASTSVPGVITPPLVMIFTTSTPRSARSPDRAPQLVGAPRLAAHRRAVAARAGDRWAGHHHGRPVAAPAIVVDHGEVVVAEIAYGGDAVVELTPHRTADDVVQLIRCQIGDSVERVRSVVGAEMHVRIDQAGQQRGAWKVGDLAAVRCGRRRRFDADAPVHQH